MVDAVEEPWTVTLTLRGPAGADVETLAVELIDTLADHAGVVAYEPGRLDLIVSIDAASLWPALDTARSLPAVCRLVADGWTLAGAEAVDDDEFARRLASPVVRVVST